MQGEPRAVPHRLTPGRSYGLQMGKRKAADEAALEELEEVLRALVEAARRRTEAIGDRSAEWHAHRDLHQARERLRSWRRPGVGVRGQSPVDGPGGRARMRDRRVA